MSSIRSDFVLAHVFFSFWQSTKFFAPLFLTAFMVSSVLALLVARKNRPVVAFFQILFFSLVGIVVAYIETMQTTIIQSILPSVLIVLTVLAQLVGGLKGDGSRPMHDSLTFGAAGAAIFLFLLSAHYIKVFHGSG